MESFYEGIHKAVAELMYAENFFLAVYDEEHQTVEFVYFIDSVDPFDVQSIASMPLEVLRKSATGYVLRTGELLHTDDSGLKRMEQQGLIENQGAACVDWLGVPLVYKGKILGALVVQSYDPKIYYSEGEEALLQFVSRQLALVLKRKQFEQELQNVNTELEQRVKDRTEQLQTINSSLENEIKERRNGEQLQSILFRISELTTKPIKLSKFFNQIHRFIDELMYAKNFYVALLDEEKKIIEFPYYVDEFESSGGSRLLNSRTGLTEKVIEKGKSILYTHRNKENDFPGRGKSAESWLGVPLKNKTKTFGVLAVQSYQKNYSYEEKDQSVLTFVANHIATAILRKSDSDSLKTAHKKLKTINDDLEKRVENRTEELQEINQELTTNIEERKNIEKQLEHDALHDSLTNLPNRALFHDRLSHALSRISRNEENPFAVLFLDLDRFKLINDSLGHHMGDLLLQEASERILNCVRPRDTVSRLGGDEFCVLLDGIEDADFATAIADRIQTALQESFEIDEQLVSSSCSIGIRLSKNQHESPTQIMRDADTAMYQAKSEGKAKYCLFDSSMHERAKDRLQLEHDLRIAINLNQFELFFQPIVSFKSNKIVSVEALLRWNHPLLGQISPAIFIPIAEETGLILEIGEQVIDMACSTLNKWEKDNELKHIKISINLSPKQIALGDLLPQIEYYLKKYKIKGERIKIEITESVLVHSFQSAKHLIKGLKNHGIEIYLDDFGTGYSSLNYLHNFPFDVLKLDQTFVQSIHKRKQNLAIVNTIRLLASGLGMGSIAEGIETIPQMKTLIELGYEMGQGYLFSKPMQLSKLKPFMLNFKMPVIPKTK
jgi:diguanylate cyclase (GGDEF)-like protein